MMQNKYLSIRDTDVLGSYATLDEAKSALQACINKDRMIIFFKKRLLKKFFKGSYNPNDHLYYVSEVVYNETNFSIQI